MKLVDRLIEFMEEKSAKIPAIEAATGIPAARIYKWTQGKAEPKTEDAQKLKDLIEGRILLTSKHVPHGTLEKSGRDQLKDEIITLLKEKIERLEQDRIDLRLAVQRQAEMFGYLHALDHHLRKLRAKSDKISEDQLKVETGNIVAQFLENGSVTDKKTRVDSGHKMKA